MAFLQIQTQPFSLAGSGASLGATSIVLKSFTDIDGNTIAMSDLGTVAYMTLEPNNGVQEEAISFTGVTQNSNGTATLTGVSTQLFKSPYTETSGLAKTHAGSTTAILTNSAGYYEEFAHVKNTESISAVWTFTVLPDTSAGDPTGDNQFARKAYVDATATGTTNIDRVVVAATAGATVAAGEIVYFDSTAKEWLLADASTSATSENVILGIAQGAGVDGGAISGGVLIQGLDTNQTGMTAGTKQFLSDTAGAISESTGTVEVSLGTSNSGSTTDLLFAPGYDQKITEDIQDALVGNNTDITVGAGNLYVTQTGLQVNAETFAADAEASDTYVITLSPVPIAYVTGMTLRFSANTANTGAATLNVNSLGAKTIKKLHDQDLATGDIESGQVLTVVYDGTNFQMQSQTSQVIDTTLEIVSTTNEIQATADTERTTSSNTYVKLKDISINNIGGVIHTTFDLKTDNGANAAFGRVYVNDIAVGTERTTTSTSFVTFVEDITVVAGDNVQIYAHTTSGDVARIQNYQIGFIIQRIDDTTVVTD